MIENPIEVLRRRLSDVATDDLDRLSGAVNGTRQELEKHLRTRYHLGRYRTLHDKIVGLSLRRDSRPDIVLSLFGVAKCLNAYSHDEAADNPRPGKHCLEEAVLLAHEFMAPGSRSRLTQTPPPTEAEGNPTIPPEPDIDPRKTKPRANLIPDPASVTGAPAIADRARSTAEARILNRLRSIAASPSEYYLSHRIYEIGMETGASPLEAVTILRELNISASDVTLKIGREQAIAALRRHSGKPMQSTDGSSAHLSAGPGKLQPGREPQENATRQPDAVNKSVEFTNAADATPEGRIRNQLEWMALVPSGHRRWRVYDIAKLAGVGAPETVSILRRLGLALSNHMSNIDSSAAKVVVEG